MKILSPLLIAAIALNALGATAAENPFASKIAGAPPAEMSVRVAAPKPTPKGRPGSKAPTSARPPAEASAAPPPAPASTLNVPAWKLAQAEVARDDAEAETLATLEVARALATEALAWRVAFYRSKANAAAREVETIRALIDLAQTVDQRDALLERLTQSVEARTLFEGVRAKFSAGLDVDALAASRRAFVDFCAARDCDAAEMSQGLTNAFASAGIE